MTGADSRHPWWAGLDVPGEATDPIADPWPVDDDELGLSDDQVRFLESLADQPPVPRLSVGLPGFNDPGINPADETGD